MLNTFALSLKQALATWPSWARVSEQSLKRQPQVLKQLVGGLTNQNYLLDADGHQLVLRLNTVDHARMGIDRYREQEVLSILAGEALVPALIYCQPDTGLLVSRYVEGRHWAADELHDQEKWESLLLVLGQVHATQGNLPNFDYQAHIENYWKQLQASGREDKSSSRVYRQAQVSLKYLANLYNNVPRVLCHHDPGPLNMIERETGALVLLDWEYAGGGWPVMDDTALIRQWQPACQLRKILRLSSYSEEEFYAAHNIWAFIDLAWYQLRRT